MKILGIDYGRAKIGLAVGETETGLVEPWGTVSIKPACRQGRYYVLSIKGVLEKEKIEKIVIGVPGGKIEAEIRVFGQRLQKDFKLPVEFFDETLTSKDAQKELIKIGKKRRSRQEMEDAFAAALMLELYLQEVL